MSSDNRSKELSHVDLTCNPLPNECALGLTWDTETDTLSFRTKHEHKTATRRGIFSVLNSLYDPLGLSSPVIQPIKVLLQDQCKSKLEWNKPIPTKLETQWTNWLQQLPLLASFQVPGCYQPANLGSIVSARIHHFQTLRRNRLDTFLISDLWTTKTSYIALFFWVNQTYTTKGADHT